MTLGGRTRGRPVFLTSMKHKALIAVAVVILAVVAAGVAWRMRVTPVTQSSTQSAQPEAPRLRRLLATRLGHPRVLRIERVHAVRDPRYAGVRCGHAAWGDSPGEAGEFRRFVASKRQVHIEGAAGFEALWNRLCVAR